ncbi:DUF6308 family protein [Rhodococcus opacus]|uniref:DUF6308 family protein n=1 Tax=Rhodococcus opacus TaxID=37919 RepID=UPI0026CFAFB6
MTWLRRVFLSVQVLPRAAWAILHTEAEVLNALLAAVGPDRDLVDEPDPLAPGWPAWDLETALWALPGIGRTKATKLIARKRPGSTRSGTRWSVGSWAPSEHCCAPTSVETEIVGFEHNELLV